MITALRCVHLKQYGSAVKGTDRMTWRNGIFSLSSSPIPDSLQSALCFPLNYACGLYFSYEVFPCCMLSVSLTLRRLCSQLGLSSKSPLRLGAFTSPRRARLLQSKWPSERASSVPCSHGPGLFSHTDGAVKQLYSPYVGFICSAALFLERHVEATEEEGICMKELHWLGNLSKKHQIWVWSDGF